MRNYLKRFLKTKTINDIPQIETPSPLDAPLDFEPELIDATMSGWFKNDTAELFDGFPISPQDTVLDVGCGDGAFISFCANQGAKVMFADIDEEKIRQAAARLSGSPAKEIIPMVSDANPLPIMDDTASKVIAMEVIEHVEDPRQFLKELYRVGKPGALYLITAPDPEAENIQKSLAPQSYFQHPNHIRIIGRSEFDQMITDSGLVIEKRTSYGFYWTMWWFFFWACKQDLSPPWHPLLQSWTKTWGLLLQTEQGPKIKQTLDRHLPKSQAIIARKPQAKSS